MRTQIQDNIFRSRESISQAHLFWGLPGHETSWVSCGCCDSAAVLTVTSRRTFKLKSVVSLAVFSWSACLRQKFNFSHTQKLLKDVNIWFKGWQELRASNHIYRLYNISLTPTVRSSLIKHRHNKSIKFCMLKICRSWCCLRKQPTVYKLLFIFYQKHCFLIKAIIMHYMHYWSWRSCIIVIY